MMAKLVSMGRWRNGIATRSPPGSSGFESPPVHTGPELLDIHDDARIMDIKVATWRDAYSHHDNTKTARRNVGGFCLLLLPRPRQSTHLLECSGELGFIPVRLGVLDRLRQGFPPLFIIFLCKLGLQNGNLRRRKLIR